MVLRIHWRQEMFLATMHSSGKHANKDTGLKIAVSTDGVTFRNLRGNDEKRSFFLRTVGLGWRHKKEKQT